MYYRPKIFFPKKTYSMFGEDLIVKDFFKKKKKGFYVDVGCYHPLDGSNTYLLYKKGFQTKSINSNTLNSILKNSKFKNKRIDFLNLDIEGNELNALKSIDLKKYQPKLICVEIHNFGMIHKNYDDYYKRNPVYKFLNNRGYKILWKNEFSFIFRK